MMDFAWLADDRKITVWSSDKRPDDFLELVRAAPFEPFRIHSSDGSSFDVHHPDMAIVQRSEVTIGVTDRQNPGATSSRLVNRELTHINRADSVNGASHD